VLHLLLLPLLISQDHLLSGVVILSTAPDSSVWALHLAELIRRRSQSATRPELLQDVGASPSLRPIAVQETDNESTHASIAPECRAPAGVQE
jgi:hypothetical protein